MRGYRCCIRCTLRQGSRCGAIIHARVASSLVVQVIVARSLPGAAVIAEMTGGVVSGTVVVKLDAPVAGKIALFFAESLERTR